MPPRRPSYDSAFFNWMTPDFAAGKRELVEAGAAESRHETPAVMGYVRTAVGPDAAARLLEEETNYRGLHKGYEDHFDRLEAPTGSVGIAAPDAESPQAALARYTAYDTIVVRALADLTLDALSAVATAAH